MLLVLRFTTRSASAGKGPAAAVGQPEFHVVMMATWRVVSGGRRTTVAAADNIPEHLSEMNVKQRVDDEVARETDRLQHVGEFDGEQQRLIAQRLSISIQNKKA